MENNKMSVVSQNSYRSLKLERQKSYRELFHFFLDESTPAPEKEKLSAQLLQRELHQIDSPSIPLPDEPVQIKDWLFQQNMQNCERYQQYLSRRQAGGQREYFQHVAAAYDFLVKVAPVKYVDGSWLYSTLKHWPDPNFQHLIMIYLEELGLGSAKANHVSMYQQLLSSLNLQDLVEGLEDEYYYQPVVQLALAYAPQQYLPEVIGFNLGYEQLPLHLLISNYELAELGLDHQYFNVHITIDNLDNGHAHRSVAALEYGYSQAANKTEFIDKLKRGYALNDVGLGSTEIIKNSDLTPLIEKIFKKKAVVGKLIHNNRCRFAQASVNEWLSNDQKVVEFLQVLQDKQWIKRGQHPSESRFWQLIHNEEGKMFGVFSVAEQQIIYDWIAQAYTERRAPFKAVTPVQQVDDYIVDYFNSSEQQALQQQLKLARSAEEKINLLLPYLAPHQHHNPTGLWATRQLTQFLFPQALQQIQ